MRRTNCLLYALDKWRHEGGYLLMRKSRHWAVPHVMHLSADRMTLTHFSPPRDLKHPAQALVGFTGVILRDDTEPARPIGVRGVLLGAAILFGLSLWWAVTRIWSTEHETDD